MSRRVYRVEQALTGCGPYSLSTSFSWNVHERRNHPLPEHDGLDVDEFCDMVDMRFGFGSLVQMARWFGDKSRRILSEHGYVVSLYSANCVVEGFNQVVFDRDTAERLRQEDIGHGVSAWF